MNKENIHNKKNRNVNATTIKRGNDKMDVKVTMVQNTTSKNSEQKKNIRASVQVNVPVTAIKNLDDSVNKTTGNKMNENVTVSSSQNLSVKHGRSAGIKNSSLNNITQQHKNVPESKIKDLNMHTNRHLPSVQNVLRNEKNSSAMFNDTVLPLTIQPLPASDNIPLLKKGHQIKKEERSNSSMKTQEGTSQDKLQIRTASPHVANKQTVKQTLPDVVIIGAWKTGTGVLNLFLTNHPNIAGHDEEINYFTTNTEKSRSWFHSKLKQPRKGQLVLENSASYFYYPKKVCRMMKEVGYSANTKFIFLVREPVMRAISHYSMEIRSRRINGTIDQNIFKIEKGNKVLNESRAILKAGYYYFHLFQWYQCFPKEQFLIVDGDLMRQNPVFVVKQVEQFLGIPDMTGTMGFVKNPKTDEYCLKSGSSEYCTRDREEKNNPVSEDTKMLLADYYKDKNKQFYQLVGRTFNWNNLYQRQK